MGALVASPFRPRAIAAALARGRVAATFLAALFAALFAALLAARPPGALAGPARDAGVPLAGYSDFEIVESAPVETSLDHPEIRNARDVWIEMARGARESIDLAEFYASTKDGSALDDVVRAIEQAAGRGVAVRFLGEERFFSVYPEAYERLGEVPGIEIRQIAFRRAAGGVHHAKYFVVDGARPEIAQVFVGSQNFDWRSLEHIQEIGVRVREPEFARAFHALFEHDWRLAGEAARDSTLSGEALRERLAALGSRGDGGAAAPGPESGPLPAAPPFPVRLEAAPGETLAFTPVMSPTGWIPDERLWDEPRLVALIDGARTEVAVQLLTYRPVSDGEYYGALEDALRRAAARGVSVRLLLADWCKRKSTIPYLKSLVVVPNIQVRLVTIPEASGGFIPYARVIHAKYLVVDGRRAWIGTSNWERDYFHESRNAGVVVESPRVGGILARFFEDGWTSDYAYPVEPAKEYEPPRIGE